MHFLPVSYLTSKWSRFRKIAPACWQRSNGLLPGLIVSRLSDQWCEHFFEGAVTGVSLLSQAAGGAPLVTVFRTAQDLYDVRLSSRVQPDEYYDFFWDFGLTARPAPTLSAETGKWIPISAGSASVRALKINRWGPSGQTGTANAVWRVAPQAVPGPVAPDAKVIRIYCEQLDETIDLNLDTLAMQFKESQIQKTASLAPWHWLLLWMWTLRKTDAEAFGRLPGALKSHLTSVREAESLSNVTEAQFAAWQRQGLLPQRLPMLFDFDVAPARDCIARQQGIAGSSEVLMLFNNQNPIPKLLLTVNSANLRVPDFQSLIVLGALQEFHGFLEVQRQLIIARRPDLQALLATPQGLRRLEEDSEIVALKSHPDAIRETQDQQDIMLRRAGNYGPTARDMQLATMQLAQATQVQALSMINPLAGVIGAMEAAKSSRPSGPPWKIYRPYLC